MLFRVLPLSDLFYVTTSIFINLKTEYQSFLLFLRASSRKALVTYMLIFPFVSRTSCLGHLSLILKKALLMTKELH